MATAAQLSPAEYVHTSFPDLDQEYVHGELVERSMPDISMPHYSRSSAGFFAMYASAVYRAGNALTYVFKLEPDVFRIPDVCVFTEKPAQLVPDTPPLIAIEIVSREDRHTALLAKLEEYRRFGIANVWVIDRGCGA